MKYLGIDYGQKRTGIAVTAPGGTMAFPRRTLIMRGKDAFFAELLALADVDRVHLVGQAGFFQEQRYFVTVGGSPVIQIDHEALQKGGCLSGCL